MGDYAKLSKKNAESIWSHYSLGSLKKFKALSLGISNSNYRIESSTGEYLLKVSNDKNQEQLNGEQNILKSLQEKGFTSSLVPFETKEKGLIYHEGEFFGVVYPFVKGIPPGPSDQTCEEIGRGIAELHNLKWTSSELDGLRHYDQVGFGPAQFKQYLKSDECPDDFSSAAEVLFPEGFDFFEKEGFQKGLIHGDLYYDNTLFQNDKLSVILDFEQSGTGELILDLGICISGTCLQKGRVIQPLIDSFLLGYQKIRPLPENELRCLNQSICLGLLSIALWRIKRFTEGNLNPYMSDSYKELLIRALVFNQTKGRV